MAISALTEIVRLVDGNIIYECEETESGLTQRTLLGLTNDVCVPPPWWCPPRPRTEPSQPPDSSLDTRGEIRVMRQASDGMGMYSQHFLSRIQTYFQREYRPMVAAPGDLSVIRQRGGGAQLCGWGEVFLAESCHVSRDKLRWSLQVQTHCTVGKFGGGPGQKSVVKEVLSFWQY